MKKKDDEGRQDDVRSIEALKEKLYAELREYDKAELEAMRLEKYKTGKLWDVGDVAIPLKDAMEHGEWEPFVEQCVQEGRISSDRNLQRAMRIRKNFERREDCVGLTVAEAEDAAKRFEKVIEQAATTCENVTKNRRSEIADKVQKLRQENERLEAELLRRAEGQGAEVEPQIEVVMGAAAEPAEERIDPDEAAAKDLVQSVSDIVQEDDVLTAQEQEAFEVFVHALGDNADRALEVVVTQMKAQLKKMYL